MKKNTRWQVFNKIKKEGWVPDQDDSVKMYLKMYPNKVYCGNYYVYTWISPDAAVAIAFHPQATDSQIIYYKKQSQRQFYEIRQFYEKIIGVSYKRFLVEPSEEILTEALL